MEKNLKGAVSIRRCVADDAAALALVGKATFLETYAGIVDGQDIVAHCERQHSVERYRELIAHAQSVLWIAAVDRTGAPVGYLVMTSPDLPLPSITPDDLEVKRIYLLSKFQGLGLGKQLMAAAVSTARDAGKKRVLLGVYSKNEAALQFYGKFGFRTVGERKFTVGANTYDDLLLGFDLV